MIEKLIIRHTESYPALLPRDLFKLLYQYAFGCEHMISDYESVCERIKAEHATVKNGTPRDIEELGDYCRVGLSYLDRGLSEKTLARLFCLSAKRDKSGNEKLLRGIEVLTDLVNRKLLPIDIDSYSASLYEWKNENFPPVRHSEKFREAYLPSYRVIAKKYVRLLPLLARIDTMLCRGNVRLAIEGGSASGKSTLGAKLAEIYGCTLFHMDDFFLPPTMRTDARLAEPGGNVHRERFLSEVLTPLSRGEEVEYRRYDCSSGTILPPKKITPTPLTITEGAYALHPELAAFYNLSIFIDIDHELQKSRILKRNSPDIAARHFSLWIPMEEQYFDTFGIRERCDIRLLADEI